MSTIHPRVRERGDRITRRCRWEGVGAFSLEYSLNENRWCAVTRPSGGARSPSTSTTARRWYAGRRGADPPNARSVRCRRRRERRDTAPVSAAGRCRCRWRSYGSTNGGDRAERNIPGNRGDHPHERRRSGRRFRTQESALPTRLADIKNWRAAARLLRRVDGATRRLKALRFAYFSTTPRSSPHDLTGPVRCARRHTARGTTCAVWKSCAFLSGRRAASTW